MAATHNGPDVALARARKLGLIVGLAGAPLLAAGAFLDTTSFFRAYLIAWVFWLGISLGSLGFLMLHHVTGGRWGFVARRLLEGATAATPVMALLFVPLLFGLKELYPWADHDGHDPLLEHKAPYLNQPFFIARTALYFAVWIGLAFLLRRWSAEDDEQAEPPSGKRFRMLSGPGIALYVLTVSFAAVDWMMSLEPHWFSTAYGLIVMIGQVISALAFVIIGLAALAREGPLARAAEKLHVHDLGNFLMAFILLWAYISFSQFLIIWYGNLAEEAPWVLKRTGPGWAAAALALVVLHFAVPFVMLLQVRFKRDIRILLRIAVLVAVMRYVDYFWLVTPAFEDRAWAISWLDAVAPLALGGIWLFVTARALQSRPLVVRHHPDLEEKAHA